MTKQPDALDRRILGELTNDGQLSAGRLAENLSVTAPTIRSRMKAMIQAGALKVAGLVNPMRVRGLTVALVGISLTSHKQLDEKLEQISKLPRVHWCAVVTGRYDIIVEIVCAGDMSDLYEFLDRDLSQIGGINSSESYVVMKSRRKWLHMPQAAVEMFQSE